MEGVPQRQRGGMLAYVYHELFACGGNIGECKHAEIVAAPLDENSQKTMQRGAERVTGAGALNECENLAT